MSTQQFKELPKTHTTYANVIKSLLPHRDSQAQSLPNHTYEVATLIIDQGNLADYRQVCGFQKDGKVPPTYFAVLSQTLQMNMMAKDDFPFAMLGLIHIENRVSQYRPIYDSEVARLTVSLANLLPHDKGQQFDFITQVFVDEVLVWEGSSTYLSRQKVAKPATPKPTPTITKLAQTPNGFFKAIEVPEDIGRRYAFISGDFNLIHLHPLSARAFGYPKAIAHGMWSKAKVLASLPLPDKFHCTVSFKSPIFLPSSVELIADEHLSFGVYGKNSDKVHLFGTIDRL